jgi:serine/threonine-protein kinase
VALSLAEPMDEPRRFNGEKGKVWSGYRAFNLGSKRRLWIAVVAPENDFVGDARQKNQALLAIIVGGLVVAFLVGGLIERGLRRRVKEEMSRVTQLGQYTLEEKLGEGGMGTVYRARHSLLRRPTAIKLLRPEKEGDEEAITRFEREVQITSRLTHPNTVAIYGYGRTPDGVFYYAMEYFAGIDLEQLVKAYGPVPPERAVHLLRQVCGSLAEAHDAGLIHRDIKPANIMLCERGGVLDVVKVLDFGMVKDVSMGSQSLDLTQQNMVMGTPMFLAPEAIRKRDNVDGRSDLYAVGAVAYFMLTGRNVFEGDTVIEIVRKHLEELPVLPSTIFPGMPDDLEQIVMDCLAKIPDERPADARVLIERLELCSVGRHWDQRQAKKWWQDSGEMPKSVPGVPSDGLQMTVELHQS